MNKHVIFYLGLFLVGLVQSVMYGTIALAFALLCLCMASYNFKGKNS